MLRAFKGWRTVIFNVATGLGMVVPPVIDLLIQSEMFSPRVTMALGIINVVGNVLLRYATTTPIGESDE